MPVKLYSAISSKTVRFHQLHGADQVRVQQKRVCPVDGEEVAFSDLVKGYEVAPEQYVVIEPEELAALEPGRTRTIEIEDFVEFSEIDPIYYDRPYYLVPGFRGAKPYRLLLEAMRETEKIALARVVLRTREQLVAIRPSGNVLAMVTMNFADEVLGADRLKELSDNEVEVSERELDVACRLVESLAAPFDPSKYHDTYREALLDLIERKAQGEEVVVRPAVIDLGLEAPDLMSALQASLDDVRNRASHDERIKTPLPTNVADGSSTGPVKGKASKAKRSKRRAPDSLSPSA
jgi:DNA end-binding protein Ku